MKIQQDRQKRQQMQNSKSDCFSGETRIRTPLGYKRIDAIKKGDIVLSIDDSGLIKPVAVNRTVSHKNHAIWKIDLVGRKNPIYVTKRPPHFDK